MGSSDSKPEDQYANQGRRRGSKFDTQPISSSVLRRRMPSNAGQTAQQALLDVPKDPSLLPGARNALTNALGLRADQTFVLMAEVGYEDAAAAFLRAAGEMGLSVRTFLLDVETCERDLFIERICEELAEADGSALVASRTGLPPRFRRAVIEIGDSQRRHAHMVGVSPAMMRQSMRADYTEMHRLGERLVERLSTCEEIVVSSGLNDELILRPDPNHRWYNGSGVLRGPGFTNLPAGEVLSCPASADGKLRPDGGVWLSEGPIRSRIDLVFEEGRLVDAVGIEGEQILAATKSSPNGERVGQICLGTNLGVLTPIGAMLQDSKIPGFHMILGYSCPRHTGAEWTSEAMLPILVRRANVTVDGQPLLVRGRYARELLS